MPQLVRLRPRVLAVAVLAVAAASVWLKCCCFSRVDLEASHADGNQVIGLHLAVAVCIPVFIATSLVAIYTSPVAIYEREMGSRYHTTRDFIYGREAADLFDY
ncbi:unnamed protein product [Durusdinium trenchii]|uniref:Uncharacterized protein n=1 Tax=Durusdinium trenchii TaxID=1381693 RepID=A0ABP0NSU5_9DINO